VLVILNLRNVLILYSDAIRCTQKFRALKPAVNSLFCMRNPVSHPHETSEIAVLGIPTLRDLGRTRGEERL
jgi:hypothetical protein